MKNTYEVILNTNTTMEPIHKKNILVEGSVSSPRIIDGRLVFFKDGAEIFVFNRCEWVYWKKVQKNEKKHLNWKEIQKNNEEENCI